MKFFNKHSFVVLAFLSFTCSAIAQMPFGRDTLYGNEWIDYNKTYYRLEVTADAIYRLSASALTTLGVPNSVTADRLQIFRNGREIKIYTSTNGALGTNDYVEFLGLRNRSELDSFAYPSGAKGLLNPEYSLISDTTSYFLTWGSTVSTQRYATIANELTNLPAAEAWYWHKQLYHSVKYPNDNFIVKEDIANGQSVYLPQFGSGEGYGDFQANSSISEHNLNFRVPNIGGKLYARWSASHSIQHYTNIKMNGESLKIDSVYGFGLREFSYDLSATQMRDVMRMELKGEFSTTDRTALAIHRIDYARVFNFNNSTFWQFRVAASENVRYLEITNFNATGVAPVLYDLTNNLRLVTKLENNIVKVALPPSVSDRDLALTIQVSVPTPVRMQRQTFPDIRPDAGDYIVITHSRFLNDNVIKDYTDYRASAAGGGYRPTVVNIEDIYAQFGYGVRRHPLAVRNFIHYVKKNWANPKFIVLVGKAREYRNIRDAADLNKNGDVDVPTWGWPASDILLAATNKNDEPVIPIGRIPIAATSELTTYLNKVKEHEFNLANDPQTIAARDWRKQIIHLSGGQTAGEQSSIKDNLNFFGSNMSKYKMGAFVSSFYKTNLDPVQVSTNDQIFARMNAGVSMMTFYGHSGANVLDFEINTPEKMTNKGKYPFFLALGCSAANTFQSTKGLGELWILEKDKGMIAFMGTSGFDFLHSLNDYGNELYRKIGETHYGKPVGEIIKATIGSYPFFNNNDGLKAVLQEWILNGDPALRITRDTMTDIIPDAATVKFEPTTLNAQLDSFKLNMDIVNIGTTRSDSMTILVRQQLPNGTLVDARSARIATPQYRQPISWSIPMPKGSAGQNRIHVRVDSDNQISEKPAPAAEGNNDMILNNGQLGVPFVVLENSLRPIYPTEFSIVSKTPITLVAQTSDPLAKTQNYLFEIDTTENFNSPIKQRTTISKKGSILKWSPSMSWRDSTVYYWRTSPDSVSSLAGYSWHNSSFTYINGSPSGWNQAHYQQFLKNNLKNMQVDEDSKKVAFAENVLTMSIRYDSASLPFSPKFFGDGSLFAQNVNILSPSTLDGTMYVMVFNNESAQVWSRPTTLPQYGLSVIGRERSYLNTYIFSLSDTSQYTGRVGLINFLKEVPTNFYVIMFTAQSGKNVSFKPEQWAADTTLIGTNLFKELEAQGATQIRGMLSGSLPYTFNFIKNKKPLAEKLARTFGEGASVEFPFLYKWNSGYMESKYIGPAKQWASFENKNLIELTPKSDSLAFDIIGRSKTSGLDTILFSGIQYPIRSLSLSSVDAAQYPYLKVRYKAFDNVRRSAPVLANWRVLYTGYPDFAVNTAIAYQFNRDTLQRGESLAAEISIENIGEYATDSVDVQYTIRDASNAEQTFMRKYTPLSKEGNLTTSFALDTRKLKGGNYKFEMLVNPKGLDLEPIEFNNYFQNAFVVQQDGKNPLLNVTFDGVRIMNNDIVSPKSTIQIELRDENKFLLLQDTSVLQLFLTSPVGGQKQIFFNDPALRFIPANNANQNKAMIEYKATFKQEGVYQLSVRAQDATGNTAGSVNYSLAADYSVAFQVILKSSISNVLNYPNPFSMRTQFVYTLTGETPPQYFKIQIMTVAGKVVREITQDELGPLRIGTHRTDYAWDGTDEFGNQLANGVYLYRIIAKNGEGKAFEAMTNDSTTEMFKKGIGKLVIMR